MLTWSVSSPSSGNRRCGQVSKSNAFTVKQEKNDNKTNSSRFANELQKRIKSPVFPFRTQMLKQKKKSNRKGFILTETSDLSGPICSQKEKVTPDLGILLLCSPPWPCNSAVWLLFYLQLRDQSLVAALFSKPTFALTQRQMSANMFWRWIFSAPSARMCHPAGAGVGAE